MGRYKNFKRAGLSDEQNAYYVARKRMVEEQIIFRGIKNEKVIKAMSEIPRHLFVPHALQDQAYRDYPVNIGEGQTISQPLMVAMMSELIELKGDERVLEIGTGSGYQTAVLSELCSHIYTIERIRSLANKARKTLYDINITNFTLRVGDGTCGWPEEAPFDCILVAAGSPEIPQVYIDQLTDGGRLVIPVGNQISQNLVLVKKVGNDIIKKVVSGCRFVKLIGKYGWSKDE